MITVYDKPSGFVRFYDGKAERTLFTIEDFPDPATICVLTLPDGQGHELTIRVKYETQGRGDFTRVPCIVVTAQGEGNVGFESWFLPGALTTPDMEER